MGDGIAVVLSFEATVDDCDPIGGGGIIMFDKVDAFCPITVAVPFIFIIKGTIIMTCDKKI